MLGKFLDKVSSIVIDCLFQIDVGEVEVHCKLACWESVAAVVIEGVIVWKAAAAPALPALISPAFSGLLLILGSGVLCFLPLMLL